MKNIKLSLMCILPIALSCNGKSNYVTITFDYKNGEPNKVLTVLKGTKIEKPSDPIKKKCKFKDWYDNNDIDWNFDYNTVNQNTLLSAKYEFDKNTFTADEPDADKKHDNANLRVMSFNVLTEKYNNNPQHNGEDEFNVLSPGSSRDNDMFDTVNTYKPDVVGFQELDYDAYNFINNKNSDYVLVNKDNFVDSENPRTVTKKPKDKGPGGQKDSSYYNAIFSTIAYNKNTIDLIDYEVKYNKETSDNHDCRYLFLATLKHKATNKKFIVSSTHWNLTSCTTSEKTEGIDTNAKKAAKNLKQAKEMASWTLDYQKRKNNIPLITTGDYNSKEFRETYNAFITDTNYQDTKYTSKFCGLVCDTYHLGDGSKDEPGKWFRGINSVTFKNVSNIFSIDHIFASKNIVPIYYDTISMTKTLNCSDHMPIYCDFSI